MSQKTDFLEYRGTLWYERNKADRGENRDGVLMRLKRLPWIKPRRILEVGCADGWRLRQLQAHYGCEVYGLEPSKEAIAAGAAEGTAIHRGTADSLPYQEDTFDMVIYGYCLGYCDPTDYLKIASEGDRILVDGGHIVIVDSQFVTTALDCHYIPFSDYGGYWYKYDFRQLWLGSPVYKLVSLWTENMEPSVVILRKSIQEAYVPGRRVITEGQIVDCPGPNRTLVDNT